MEKYRQNIEKEKIMADRKFINPMLDMDLGEVSDNNVEQEKSSQLQDSKFINPILGVESPVDISDPGFMGGTMSPSQALGSLFTGEGRTEFPKAPEFAAKWPETEEELKASLGQLVSAEPEQFADIVVEQVPGAKQFKDKFGNVMIKYKGQDFYANKPGMSGTDITKFIADIGSYLPAGKLASVFNSLAMRTGAMGLGSAATSASQDLAAGAMGSQQGVSGERTLTAGLFGSGGELIAPAVSNIARRFQSVPKVVDQQGNITELGKQILSQSNIDPRSVTPDIASQFQSMVTDLIRKGQGELDMEAPIRAAVSKGRTSQFGIPKTKGQATGDVEQLGFEDAAASGAYGPEAQQMMLQSRKQQREAVEGAVGKLKSDVGTGTINTPEEAAEVVLGRTQSKAEEARKGISRAYDDVKNPIMATSFPKNSLDDLQERMDEKVTFDMFLTNEKLAPATTDLLRHIGKQTEIDADFIPMSDIEQTRKYINRLAQATEKADKSQVIQLKKVYDEWLDDNIDEMLFNGDLSDELVLENLKKARKLRFEYGKKFEENKSGKFSDDAGKIIQKMAEFEDVTPLEVSNWIYGTAKLGEVPRSNRVISRLKEIFPEDSPEWGALREGALLRIFKGSGSKLPGPQAMVSKLDGVLDGKGLAVTNKIFNEDQVKMLRSFREDLKDLVPADGTTNPSKSAYKIAEIARQYMTRIMPGIELATGDLAGYMAIKGMEKMSERGAKKGVKEAIRGYEVPTAKPSRIIPSTSVATGQQVQSAEEEMKKSPAFDKLKEMVTPEFFE